MFWHIFPIYLTGFLSWIKYSFQRSWNDDRMQKKNKTIKNQIVSKLCWLKWAQFCWWWWNKDKVRWCFTSRSMRIIISHKLLLIHTGVSRYFWFFTFFGTFSLLNYKCNALKQLPCDWIRDNNINLTWCIYITVKREILSLSNCLAMQPNPESKSKNFCYVLSQV